MNSDENACDALRSWVCGVNVPYTFKNRTFGQAMKGVWWMPWGKEPTKDAVTGDMHRGAGNKL